MPRVKGQFAPVLAALGTLFATPPVKRLTYRELGDLLGWGAEAVKSWAKRGVPPEAHLRVLELAEARGPQFLAHAKSLLEGGKKAPRMPQDERSADTRVAGGNPEPLGAPPSNERIVSLISDAVAGAFTQALAQDNNELEKTRVGRKVLGRLLNRLAYGLQQAAGVDATDLLAVANDLEDGLYGP